MPVHDCAVICCIVARSRLTVAAAMTRAQRPPALSRREHVLYQPRQSVRQQSSEVQSLLSDVQNLTDRLASALFHAEPIAKMPWTLDLP
jgi:hypothetical protein